MQYALINGIKSEPIKGTKGVCIGCGKAVIAKCGIIKLHHWSHITAEKCDSWWENETEWHREWKSHFHVDTREVTFYDPVLKEYHRADVNNKKGVTIEFQNSPLTIAELTSRNKFYNKIVWIVNGKRFKGFEIIENIPDPHSSDFNDYDFSQSSHLSFTRKSEANNRMQEKLSRQSKEFRQVEISNIHQSFLWKYPHKGWLFSSAPIFIDFGEEWLYLLKRRIQTGMDFLYLKKISKLKFIDKYNV